MFVCLLQATDGFLFVAQCENGCIIYVSDSVTPVLSFSQVYIIYRIVSVCVCGIVLCGGMV